MNLEQLLEVSRQLAQKGAKEVLDLEYPPIIYTFKQEDLTITYELNFPNDEFVNLTYKDKTYIKDNKQINQLPKKLDDYLTKELAIKYLLEE